jgi:hypothetical protein
MFDLDARVRLHDHRARPASPVDGSLERTPNDQAARRHGLLHLGSGAMAGAALEHPSRSLGAVAKVAPSFFGRSSAVHHGCSGAPGKSRTASADLCTDRSHLSPLACSRAVSHAEEIGPFGGRRLSPWCVPLDGQQGLTQSFSAHAAGREYAAFRGFPWPPLACVDRAVPSRQGGGRWFEPSIAHQVLCRGFVGWGRFGLIGYERQDVSSEPGGGPERVSVTDLANRRFVGCLHGRQPESARSTARRRCL